MDDEKEASNQRATNKNKRSFNINLSWWQILPALAIVGWLAYGDIRKDIDKSTPPSAMVGGGGACDRYRDLLRELVHGASNMEIHSQNIDGNGFACAVDEKVVGGRNANISVRQVTNPSAAIVEYTKEFLPPANFRVIQEPDLGAGGFSVIGSYVKDGGDDYLAYYGSSTSSIMVVSLAKGKKTDSDFSLDERKIAKEIANRVKRDMN
jgi:hypothetical protein